MPKFLIKFHNQEDFSICYESLRIDVFKQGKKELDNLYNSYDLYADLLFNDHPTYNASILKGADLNQSMYVPAFEAFDVWKKSFDTTFPYSQFLLRAISSLDNIYDDLMGTKSSIIKVIKDKKNFRGEITESKLIDLLEYPNSATEYILRENFSYLDNDKIDYAIASINKNLNPQQSQTHYTGSHQLERERQHKKDVEWMREMLRHGKK